jgi:hypothetical protein
LAGVTRLNQFSRGLVDVTWTVEQRRAYARDWRAANHDRVVEYQRRYADQGGYDRYKADRRAVTLALLTAEGKKCGMCGLPAAAWTPGPTGKRRRWYCSDACAKAAIAARRAGAHYREQARAYERARQERPDRIAAHRIYHAAETAKKQAARAPAVEAKRAERARRAAYAELQRQLRALWREPGCREERARAYRLANAEILRAYTHAVGDRRRAQRLSGLVCRRCGKAGPEWADNWHGRRFCSRACRQKWFRSQSNSYLQRYGLRVVRLHGAKCWWCKRKVQFSIVDGRIKSRYAAPDKRAASIDHLTPRSQGGSNALENLRLVHFACKWGRYHSRRPEQQFLLASGTT